MAKPQHRDSGDQDVPAVSILWAASLMAGIWILLVGGVHRDEMLVGAACVAGAVLILRVIAGVLEQRMQFTPRDLFSGWKIPWYAAKDNFVVSRVMLRALLFGVHPQSGYWVCGFKTSKSDPQDVGRRILVTSYSSATPNTIVIGVDYAQSRLLFHQLAPDGVSATMRELGAQG